MGSLKGGGDKTQTTTQNTSTTYAPWTQAAGQNGYATTAGMTNPFLQTPAYSVAGLNPDQTKAFDLARQMAQGAFTGSATGVPTGATMMPASSTAATAQAQQVGANDYQAYLNPYINGVVNQASSKARKELRQTEADIGAKYAAAGAFGGGREVLARGKAQDNFDENLQATTAQLLAQGFDTATATALANTQLRQQTAENNAGRQQQTALTNAGYQQDANSANLGYGLQAAQVAEAMRNGQTDRQNSALQALLGVGNQEQLFAQSVLDSPWTALQRLLQATPAVYDQTSVGKETSPKQSSGPSPLQTILGIGAKFIPGLG